MSRKNVLEVANFICKIGDKVMLEMFDDIVGPAFSDSSLRRTYGESEYFFTEVSVDVFGEDVGASKVIFGRLIKKTKLKSEQAFVEGTGLVRRRDSIDDAPSSIFALILNTHRLLIANETAYAPDINVFASTARRFINEKRRLFVSRYAREKNMSVSKARSEIGEVYLEVVPLPSHDDIDIFIDQYRLVKKIKIVVLKTNHERDRVLWNDQLRSSAEPLKANVVNVEIKQGDGLQKEELKDFVHPIVADGLSRVVFSGKGMDGQDLVGDTTTFRLKQEVSIGNTIRSTVENMLNSFRASVKRGLIDIRKTEGSNEQAD